MATEEMNNQIPGDDREAIWPPSAPNDDNGPQEGFTFKWFNLFLGIAICLWWSQGGSSTNWTFYLYLAVVVVIHELGHVVAGKYFGCFIKEMQVFFLPFVSYKPQQNLGGSSWRDIKWSLGVLPLGGVTVFKSRALDGEDHVDGMEDSLAKKMTPTDSPFIEDKPAWQRLLISAAGVLFNIATFLILYFALPYMSYDCYDLLWPLVSLSLFLAVLNILPIYPLDGGSIVFALFEMITGKKPSPGFTNVCAWIGCIFIVLFFWIFPEWLGGILGNILGKFF